MFYLFRLTFFSIFILVFFSCSKKSEIIKGKNEINVEDQEIYNVVFNEIIGHDSISRQILNFYNDIQIEAENNLYPSNRKEYEESGVNKLSKTDIDSAQLHVIVNNEIVNLKEAHDISNIISNDNFKYNFSEVDTTYIPLLRELNNFTDISAFNVSQLSTGFNYKIISNISDFKEDKNNLSIGRISFSRIIYNKSKSKACVYAQHICGGECGGGHITFLKKINNKWVISGRKNLWVA